MIYLDNAATTVVSPSVRDAIVAAMQEDYGNPGTLYSCGRKAKDAVDQARKYVAESINAKPEQIIFTSGGSEANNMVFAGTAEYLKAQGKDTVVVSAIEHDSVLKAAESMCMKHGFCLVKIGVSRDGIVSVETLEEILQMYRNRVGLVSIMYVNNEIGSVNQDIDKLCEVSKRYGALFHTDCVQAFGTQDIDVEKIGCDFLSVSSHKIHGPKGVGSLFVSDRVLRSNALSPIICGGAGQEFGLRGGTENVPGIVGFGQACSELQASDRDKISNACGRFIAEFIKGMKAKGLFKIMSLNGFNPEHCLKTISITLRGIDNETLMLAMDHKGICIGTGSACRSHEVNPSHVLKAIGLSNEDAMSTIRISFSKHSTLKDVTTASMELVNACELLASVSSQQAQKTE